MKSVLAKCAIVIGLLACAVSHSGHQTLFLMSALALVAMLELRPKHFVKLAAMLCVLGALTATMSTIYWAHMESWYYKVIHHEGSPKRMVTVSASEILASPKNLLLGTGMGQFGSRAALIASGEYLQRTLPSALVGQSGYFRQFVRPAIFEAGRRGEGSIMAKPYYTTLTVLVESGLPLALLLVVLLARQFRDNRRLVRAGSPRAQVVGILANVGLIFFVLCCFIENYLEYPQAIFLPALLYVAARTSVQPVDQQSAPRTGV